MGKDDTTLVIIETSTIKETRAFTWRLFEPRDLAELPFCLPKLFEPVDEFNKEVLTQ
jgi:hypothetical protein